MAEDGSKSLTGVAMKIVGKGKNACGFGKSGVEMVLITTALIPGPMT